MGHLEDAIPSGMLCYSGGYVCPYWSQDTNGNAACSYLGMDEAQGDHLPLIWDQVKECGVKLGPHADTLSATDRTE